MGTTLTSRASIVIHQLPPLTSVIWRQPHRPPTGLNDDGTPQRLVLR
jgi:hypothetical protein